MDAVREVDPTCMNSDDVYVSSEFSIIKVESEVSLVPTSFSLLAWLFMCVCVCVCVCVCMYIHVFYM
jgi:hypothetical protein